METTPVQKKEFIFIQISEACSKNNFLQHIHELQHIPIDNDMDINDLFEKLRDNYKNDPVKLDAVNRWIEFNETTIEHPADFTTKLLSQTFEVPMYAICDFYPVK